MADKENPKKEKPERKLPIGAIDVMAVVGLGSISYGAWLVYKPAGFIVFGGLVLVAAVMSARGG